MAEQAMQGAHRKCGCEMCAKSDAICFDCTNEWPCDGSVARAALERIEALAMEGRGEPGSPPFRVDRLVTALRALREIRDIARETLGEQT